MLTDRDQGIMRRKGVIGDEKVLTAIRDCSYGCGDGLLCMRVLGHKMEGICPVSDIDLGKLVSAEVRLNDMRKEQEMGEKMKELVRA